MARPPTGTNATPSALRVAARAGVSTGAASRVTGTRDLRDPEPFDWYQRYTGLKDIIAQHIKKEDSILMVGAGNSRACAPLASPAPGW